MRILVYGAGVQGCELAHRLLQNKKNVVTMLARGEWKERLDQRGLVIRHWAQCRTTVDRVATIDTLAPDDCYDLVFVTMQAGQLPDVLPILKQNRSEYFVFVGNDPHAVEVMQAMQRPADKIAFGFQSSGGHRDVDKVVSAHVGVDMTIGGATAIGNQLNVVVQGNHNTVIVNSRQTNNGNVTAGTVLNGTLKLND